MTGLLSRLRPRRRTLYVIGLAVLSILLVAAIGLGLWLRARYSVADSMEIAVTEYTNFEYPEDPADRSVHFGEYSGRKLTLVRKDDTHFDFILDPGNAQTATIIFRDVNVSLMTPSEPEWTKGDAHLERIALVDRQWNRQQVRFDPHSPHVEVSGGDGFEKANLCSAELAKNCLNAGLWEGLLFVRENGHKALYYQNWFTFPLGHYKSVFEHNTGLSYWKHWYKLEHWSDPAGTPAPLDGLRKVLAEREVKAAFDPSEPIIAAGEQVRKRRTTDAENVRTWGDFVSGQRVRYATFRPPGRYDVNKPWKNEYWRLSRFTKAILRDIQSPASPKPLQEMELIFENKDTGAECRFIVSGFDLAALPQLPVEKYPDGLYMPMGIGVPPFFQSYDDLQKNPPDESPYFCVMLDSESRWINHHEVAIDGPVMHRDAGDPNKLHVYLLSYERHSLVAHFMVSTSAAGNGPIQAGKASGGGRPGIQE